MLLRLALVPKPSMWVKIGETQVAFIKNKLSQNSSMILVFPCLGAHHREVERAQVPRGNAYRTISILWETQAVTAILISRGTPHHPPLPSIESTPPPPLFGNSSKQGSKGSSLAMRAAFSTAPCPPACSLTYTTSPLPSACVWERR